MLFELYLPHFANYTYKILFFISQKKTLVTTFIFIMACFLLTNRYCLTFFKDSVTCLRCWWRTKLQSVSIRRDYSYLYCRHGAELC
jgi:hypothetical protein